MLKAVGIPQPIIEKAAKQGGYITRAQLLELGLSASAIDRRVSGGDFKVVSSALYQVIPSTDHIDLIRGALLALPRAVASHQSAAHLLGFPRLPTLEPTVTVPSHTTHAFQLITVRRSDDLEPVHLTWVDGVRVTNVARTVFDLAGVLSFGAFEAITEALILAGRLEMRHLTGITNQLARRGKRGAAAAHLFVDLRSGKDPGATTLERRGRATLAAGGLPAPIAQYALPWDPARRFDDAYPDARLALEWDSRSWHAQRAAMSADRKRDREAAIFGWVVIRFTWQDITENPREVAATVASLLERRLLPNQTQGSHHR